MSGDADRSWLSRMACRFDTTWPRDTAAGCSTHATPGLSRVLEVNRLLELTYGTPDLGNKDDPVEELVYIILSRRTRETAYQQAFDALKAAFGGWEELAEAPVQMVEDVIRPSGLARKKARSIQLALGMLVETFGSCTLAPTAGWSDEEVHNLLCSLPEVGPKSAACVMMWSLDRATFPVDTHVGRVLERVGVWSEHGLSLKGQGHKGKQATLADLLPPSIRLELHVNALQHGRAVCKTSRPRCGACVIAELCDSGRDKAARASCATA